MPKTGPKEGSLMATIAFLPNVLKLSASPIVVVVLPSPAGVGLIAVTSTSLPLFLFKLSSKDKSILALYLPYCST